MHNIITKKGVNFLCKGQILKKISKVTILGDEYKVITKERWETSMAQGGRYEEYCIRDFSIVVDFKGQMVNIPLQDIVGTTLEVEFVE